MPVPPTNHGRGMYELGVAMRNGEVSPRELVVGVVFYLAIAALVGLVVLLAYVLWG